MKTIDVYFIAAIMAVFTLPLQAAPLTVPNSFNAGTPTVAAEVNANFAAVKSAVDDNDSKTTNNKTSINKNRSLSDQNSIVISRKQERVSGACPVGKSIRVIKKNGTVICQADTNTDTNTTYSAGNGLSLNGTTFSAPGMPGADISSTSASISLTSNAVLVRQVTIVAPTAGVVFLSASGRYSLSTTTNSNAYMRMSLSRGASPTIDFSVASTRSYLWPGGLGGTFAGSFHTQDLVSVTAGTNTFYLHADSPRSLRSGITAKLGAVTLTALFVPQRL